MLKKIRRSPVFWAITCVISQVFVSAIFSSDMATIVASSVLIIAALFIWRLEKYQGEMPVNRYSMAFAIGAVALIVTNLWFYANVATKLNLG